MAMVVQENNGQIEQETILQQVTVVEQRTIQHRPSNMRICCYICNVVSTIQLNLIRHQQSKKCIMERNRIQQEVNVGMNPAILETVQIPVVIQQEIQMANMGNNRRRRTCCGQTSDSKSRCGRTRSG